MEKLISKHSKVHRLASLIEQDVRKRGLAVGDPYLTASEAGDSFRVDQFTATRALNLLAKRGVLVRKRGVGTFIGEVKEESTGPMLRTLLVLCGVQKESEKWVFPIGEMLQGLHVFMPGYQVQSYILPKEKFIDPVRTIIRQGSSDGTLTGILLLSCPREVQELIVKNDLPAVSFGSVYPNTSSIASVDQDQFEVGRLQAKYLLDRGHRRVMLLMNDTWRQGDNRMVEGVNHAMSEAGLNMGSLITRSIPEEESYVRNEIHRLLFIDNRPTGLICRCPQFAETAVEVLESKSLRVPDDLDVVFSSNFIDQSSKLNLARVCPKLSRLEIAALVVKTLDKIISDEPLENLHVNLPVEIVGPEGEARQQK